MTLTYLGPTVGDGDLIVPAPQGAPLDPLLASAQVYIDAARNGGDGTNEGILGAAGDLQVVTGDLPGTTATVEVPATPVWVDDGPDTGWDIDPQDPETSGSDAGFYIDAAFDFSGDLTVFLDFTPQVAPVVTNMKYLGNLADQIPNSPGFVFEDITGLIGSAVAAVSDGVTPAAVLPEMIGGRQQWVMVLDRPTLRFYRNGTQVGSDVDASAVGDATSSAELVVGPGQRFHRLGVWQSALTAGEVASL